MRSGMLNNLNSVFIFQLVHQHDWMDTLTSFKFILWWDWYQWEATDDENLFSSSTIWWALLEPGGALHNILSYHLISFMPFISIDAVLMNRHWILLTTIGWIIDSDQRTRIGYDHFGVFWRTMWNRSFPSFLVTGWCFNEKYLGQKGPVNLSSEIRGRCKDQLATGVVT